MKRAEIIAAVTKERDEKLKEITELNEVIKLLGGEGAANGDESHATKRKRVGPWQRKRPTVGSGKRHRAWFPRSELTKALVKTLAKHKHTTLATEFLLAYCQQRKFEGTTNLPLERRIENQLNALVKTRIVESKRDGYEITTAGVQAYRDWEKRQAKKDAVPE